MADEEVDQQIAANAHARLAQRIKEQLQTELHQTCETQDRAIKEAWQAILASVQAVKDTQRKVVSAYKTDLREKMFGIVTADLPDIALPSYHDIAAHFTNPFSRSFLVDTTPAPSPTLLSPQASPVLPGSALVGPSNAATVTDKPCTARVERSGTMTADEEEASVPNNEHSPPRRVAKRGGGSLLSPRQPPKKRAKTCPDDDIAMRTINAKSVRGRDHIFRFPSLGRSWYVVRCNLGQPHLSGFVKFTSHPFDNTLGIDSSPAMKHFKFWRTCKGHEAIDYTPKEILLKFGYKVVGDEVDQKWVDESNEKASYERDYAGELSIPNLVASNQVLLARTQPA